MTDLVKIRTAMRSDFDFLLALTARERWGFSHRDLSRMLYLEPAGCFVALLNGQRAGFTTAFHYGRRLGWIGNVVVEEAFRGKGIGLKLTLKAVRHLKSRGVKYIGLFSKNDTVDFYKKLGFDQTGLFLRWNGEGVNVPLSGTRQVTRSDLKWIKKLDAKSFGGDRGRLIERLWLEFPGLSFYTGEPNKPTAYLLAKSYSFGFEIGPWVCSPDRLEDGEVLLCKLLNSIPSEPIDVNTLAENSYSKRLLEKHNFKVQGGGAIMYLGGLSNRGASSSVLGLGLLDKG